MKKNILCLLPVMFLFKLTCGQPAADKEQVWYFEYIMSVLKNEIQPAGADNPGLQLLKEKKYKEAAEVYAKDNTKREYRIPLAFIRLYITKEYQLAYDDFQYLRNVHPGPFYSKMNFALGLSYFGLQKWAYAYNRLMGDLDHADTIIRKQVVDALAIAIFNRFGSPVSKESLFASHTLAKKIDYNAMHNLTAAEKEGLIPQYKIWFDEAIKMNPYNLRACINMGAAYDKAGFYQKALDYYMMAKQMDTVDHKYYDTYPIAEVKRHINGEAITPNPSSNYGGSTRSAGDPIYCNVPVINESFLIKMNKQIQNDINNWNSVTKFGQMYRESPAASTAASRVSSSYSEVLSYCLGIKSDAERLKRLCGDPAKNAEFDKVATRAAALMDAAKSSMGKWGSTRD
ncbi:MAG: hypothetical protein JNM14_15955 [Ferruginibacter sp.]|nr:hypothetical protein [Ferruginibacter sp.]